MAGRSSGGPFCACRATGDGSLHHGLEQARLAAVGAVDGLDDHAGGRGDAGKRRAGIAALQERLVGGDQDVVAGLGRLCLSPPGVVAAAGLDTLTHSVPSS